MKRPILVLLLVHFALFLVSCKSDDIEKGEQIFQAKLIPSPQYPIWGVLTNDEIYPTDGWMFVADDLGNTTKIKHSTIKDEMVSFRSEGFADSDEFNIFYLVKYPSSRWDNVYVLTIFKNIYHPGETFGSFKNYKPDSIGSFSFRIEIDKGVSWSMFSNQTYKSGSKHSYFRNSSNEGVYSLSSIPSFAFFPITIDYLNGTEKSFYNSRNNIINGDEVVINQEDLVEFEKSVLVENNNEMYDLIYSIYGIKGGIDYRIDRGEVSAGFMYEREVSYTSKPFDFVTYDYYPEEYRSPVRRNDLYGQGGEVLPYRQVDFNQIISSGVSVIDFDLKAENLTHHVISAQIELNANDNFNVVIFSKEDDTDYPLELANSKFRKILGFEIPWNDLKPWEINLMQLESTDSKSFNVVFDEISNQQYSVANSYFILED